MVGREGAGEAGSSGRRSWVGMQGRPQAVAMRCRWSVRKEEVLGINTKGDRSLENAVCNFLELYGHFMDSSWNVIRNFCRLREVLQSSRLSSINVHLGPTKCPESSIPRCVIPSRSI